MRSNSRRRFSVPFIATAALILAAPRPSVAQTPGGQVTFTKDVAPIFQEKCEACHRPESIAPMSLRTYEEARPWARSIRARVESRQMPPWHIDKTVGIQQFKNDRSLSDDQIATFVAWVDQGALKGDPQGHAARSRLAVRPGLELRGAIRPEGAGPDHPHSAVDAEGRRRATPGSSGLSRPASPSLGGCARSKFGRVGQRPQDHASRERRHRPGRARRHRDGRTVHGMGGRQGRRADAARTPAS